MTLFLLLCYLSALVAFMVAALGVASVRFLSVGMVALTLAQMIPPLTNLA